MQLKFHNIIKTLTSNRGDTIVEVLIALTVLSMTMGIGFAIVGKSSSGLQANKEQFQAQQLANLQVEYLRASGAGANGGAARSDFAGSQTCLKDNAGTITVANGVANCTGIELGGANIYSVEISCVDITTRNRGATCNTSPSQTSVYSIVISWENVKNGRSQLELQYAM